MIAWQDVFFLIGEVFFIITLVPMLFNKKKQVPLWTSAGSFATLMIFFVFPWATQNLPLAVISATGSAIMWGLIAIFRRIKK